MPNSNISLETLISKETLQKSLSGIVFIFVILFISSVILVVYQNDKLQEKNIFYLTDKLDNTLANFQQQVENLANNDLIINSIVDDTNRNNYLPIFFRSLKLNNSSKTSIVFTDYTGKVITGKNTSLHQEYAHQFNWREKVLDKGMTYFEYSEIGLITAAPVLFAEFPEGAIISYVANLQELIPVAQNNATLIFIDNNNKVLFSSNNQVIEYGSLFIEQQFQFWSKKKLPYLTGQIVSIEPSLSAYGNIFWLAIIITLSLIFIFLGLMLNVKSTAKFAANSIKDLQKTLADAIVNNGANLTISEKNNEPIEFIAIRKKFNTVLVNLFNQTFSLQKFTSVINSLDEILFVLDLQQNIILNNSSYSIFCKSIGVSTPQDVSKILPKEVYLSTESNHLNVEIKYSQIEQKNSDDSLLIQWSASDYIDDKGRILGKIFVGKDISLAKKLEIELLIKNQAIDSAQTSILIVDAKQSQLPIIYVNKAFSKLTGYSAEEAIGQNCRFLQGKNTEKSHIEIIKSAINKQEAITITLTNYKKNGSEFKNELTISPIANEHGFVTHFLGIQLDVTEREATANYLKLAKQKAEESTQLKSEFLASMSHEIRTPMNGVVGMLDLLLMSNLNHEQQHNAEIAKDSAHSLLNIINDILDFSKIESGKLEIESSAFNVISLFSHVTKAHAQHAHDKGIELVVDTTEIDSPIVLGDSGRIRQILNNLISNAIKFTDKGSVSISATLTQSSDNITQLNCQVSDSGIGIAENRLEHVFDSFTQADSSTTRLYGGTGLGLAISSKLCKLMNGSIDVTSQESLGSQFNFNIQLTLAENTETDNIFNIKNTNILILDKEIQSAKALGKQLEKWGAKVVTDTKENNYNEHIEKSGFNIVFIDTSYAKGNVIELVKDLPHKYKTQIAFVLMTKVNENQDERFILDAGFRYFFTKPATADVLALALESLLNKAPSEKFATNDNRVKSKTREQKIPILLVEDNRTNQLVANKILSELDGKITIANNGKEAIDILNNTQTPFKLIFMDCQMPVLDGYQTTERIRAGAAGKENENIPIIAMTANAMKGDKEKCLLFGMDDYISKPIKIDLIRKKIALWLK